MRKIYSMFFAALAFSAASCQVETIEPDEAPVKEVMTITAGFNTDTKTALAENGMSTLWNRNDLVSVFDARTENNNRKFSIVAEDDAEFPASTATFATEEEFQMPEYPLDQALIVALYPYQEEAFCNFMNPEDGKNLITGLNIPAEQIAVKDGFDSRAAFALATDKYTDKDNVRFKNLYSLLKVSVAEEGVKEIKVVISSLDKAVGDAQVVLNREVVDNTPVFNGGELQVVDNGSEEVTLKFEDEESTFEKDAVYGIAVAPVCYNNIKVYLDGELVKDVTPSMDAFLSANKFYTIKDLKKPATRSLSFPEETYNVLLGNEFTAPELSGETEGVEYTSSNEEVATVDETTGAVTILAEGTTVITAKAPKTATLLEGEASYTLVVGAKADRGLAFNPTSVEVAYDATSFELPALTGEAEGVVYTSSNTEVATVDEATGEVTITGVGETVITASAQADETHLEGSASYTLTVTKTERSVSFAEASQTVTYGDPVVLQTLTGVTDADVITYSITEGEAATIENGALKLVKAGTVTITATVAETDTQNECSASYTLTVEKAQRTVSFEESSKTVTYGDAVVLPELNGVTGADEITYSAEGDAATITTDGAVTLVKAGTVTITATVAETDTHMSATATCTLVVEVAVFEPEDGYIYMRPSAEWSSDNARFAAYFFNGTWKDMTLVEGQLDIYQCDIPEGETNVIFCRMNPSETENNFNDGVRWTQTSDLTMLNGCLYTVSGWNDGEWSGEPAVDPIDASGLIVGLSGKFDGEEMWGDPDGDRKAEYKTVEYTDESIYAGTYTFELADLEMTANDKFKIRIDGGWIGSGNATITGINLGSTDGDGNFIVTESGTYNVTFTFSWDGCNYSNVRVKFEKQGGTEPEPVQTCRIYLNKNWEWKNIKIWCWEMNKGGNIYGDSWPGTMNHGSETVAGKTYLYWDIPENYIGKTVGLLITGNEGNGTFKQTANVENIVLDRDYCFKFEWTSQKGDHLVEITR